MKPRSKLLIIAGSDSSGGAGIQADIKTVTSLGSYAMTAITAVTAQNTTGVNSIVGINSKEIFKQITFTCKDIRPDAIKIGMLHSTSVIKSVISALKKIKASKIVLDPVMVAKGGARLINDRAIYTLKTHLIKRTFLITPNIPEAEVLTKITIKNSEDMIKAAHILLKLGAKNVLIKGGHLKSKDMKDILVNKKAVKIFKNKKFLTKNTHGTGCTLSAAICSYLAKDKSRLNACRLAKEYLHGAILSASDKHIGKGNGPVDHFFRSNA